MKKLMHLLFLSCLKASELIEKKIHFSLSVTEKIQLKFHKVMCDACTRYEKQSIFLERSISACQKHKQSQPDVEHLKKLIVDKLADDKN